MSETIPKPARVTPSLARTMTTIAVAGALMAAGCWGTDDDAPGDLASPLPEAGASRREREEAVVRHVIDGDTVVLEDGRRVRILLVDTPEATLSTECFGAEATAFSRQLLEGQEVLLTSDVEETDRYGRTLAYVDVGGHDVSEALVRGGYACVLHIAPNGAGRVQRLRGLERAARQARRGLWGACPVRPC